QDGTPLVGEVKQSAVNTVAFGRPATAEKIVPTQNFIDLPTEPPKPAKRYQPYPQARLPKPKRSRRGLITATIVLSATAILGLGVLGGLYFGGKSPALAKMNGEPSISISPNAPDRPADITPVSIDSPASADTVPPGKMDIATVKKQIAGIIDS